jgi:poly(3-hydroxybutyrate) depolymerase
MTSVQRVNRRAALGAASLLALMPQVSWPETAAVEQYGGRALVVRVPAHPAPAGEPALVVVLHGGLGSAERIESRQSESPLNLDALAEKHGFFVAYLNGTKVGQLLPAHMRGWNAGGGCCGLPFKNNVDDVGYITGAVNHLISKYGIAPQHVYALGHSNGAMMAQRIECETGLFAAAVAVSGPLNLDTAKCPGAQGRRILAIHGVDDANVPVAGGRGTKGISDAVFNSEQRSRQVFEDSGATYTLQLVAGADHFADHIDAVLRRTEGVTLGEKALRFFGIPSAAP